MKNSKLKEKLQLLFFVLIVLVLIPACKEDEPYDSTDTSLIKDVDGHVYHTIRVGNQIWMTENLRTTKYNDGKSISNVTDSLEWVKLSKGAYCNYNNDKTIGNKYGRLYNFYAVNTGKLAPKGWHVATNEEWITLQQTTESIKFGLDFLGYPSTSVAKMLADSIEWDASTFNGAIGNNLSLNNTIGFSAVPSGYRFNYGMYNLMGKFCIWWSSTETSETNAWYRYLSNNGIELNSGSEFLKSNGFTVRCIKD